ncbi:Acetyltransferase (GNAT) family protein [compost metagenome]|uniref:GNAT family N-acetyltransferase n=1 Tax=Paenibacillus sp. CGMCC 1.18879 TaxID=2834466 RepID=UPI000FA91BB8|nr:GNAT family N-acetyltransferase [Paenibacillus sp. CGMCC 1.18879]MBY9077114.1 GNAT family N-acetyltransferase [Paenibacillus sp. CGMCC 1.18879]
MILRKALIKDVPELSQLRVAMLNEKHTYPSAFNNILSYNTNEYLINGIEQNSLLTIVAEKEDKIVSMGCINYFILPPNDWCPSGKTAYVGNLYTTPPNRRNGIAKEILKRLVEDAKERSCERILLNTSELGENLYKEIGFEFSSTAMAFYPFGIIPE